jgi:hypothetical protein
MTEKTLRASGLSWPLILIFVVSGFTIMLELTLTRFLSFLYWSHVVYIIITFCMLGYGIASVLSSRSAPS